MKEVRGVLLGLTPQPVKSSYCGENNSCVMIGSSVASQVEVTDSKLDNSPVLKVSPEAFETFSRNV